MNDLISRSKLEKKLCEKKAMYTSVATKEAFDKTISIVWEMPDETGWISVDDRLPEKEQKVLVFYKALGEENRIHNDVMATNWRTNKGDFIQFAGYKVTHWRPLPEPPKEE